MARQGEKTLHLPCRVGELTFWNPSLRLWVYQAGLYEDVSEDAIVKQVAPEARTRDGSFISSLRTSGAAKQLSLRNGFVRYVQQPAERYVVDLSESFEQYMKGFNAKTRSTLRRKVRRFEKESGGSLDVREYRTPDGMRQFFPLARAVSASSYQEQMLDAGLPDDEEFFQQMLAGAENGNCRGYLLFLDGTAAAYLYCPIHDGVVHYTYVGHDQALKTLSPGTVLLLNVLERLFEDPGMHTFDFLEGGGPGSHKAFFGNRLLHCENVFLLRPTPRNVFLVLVHATSTRLSRGLAWCLDRIGLKRHLQLAVRRMRGSR